MQEPNPTTVHVVGQLPKIGASDCGAGSASRLPRSLLSNLEVHHKDFRSQSGDNSEENLITLCAGCHSRVHRGSD